MAKNQSKVKIIEKAIRTPEGFLEVPIIIAKKMVMPYSYAGKDGEETEVNELLDLPYDDPEFVNSCNGLPFVLEHPLDEKGNPVDFNPENYADEVKGIILDPYAVSELEEIRGKLRVWDEAIIELIESGEIDELSQGYDAEMIEQSGIHNGEAYQMIQKPYPFNHHALTENGRGGQKVKILYNSLKLKSKMKVNSAIAKELYDKFLKGEIMRRQVTKRRNEDDKGKDEKKKETTPDKENNMDMVDEAAPLVPSGEDKILSALEGIGKMLQMLLQKAEPSTATQIGNAGGDEFVGVKKDEGSIFEDQILNKAKTNAREISLAAIRESDLTYTLAQSVLGSDVSTVAMKYNSLHDFKRHVLVEAGEDKDEVSKYNALELNAEFKSICKQAKRNANQPRRKFREDNFHDGEVDASSAGY